MTERPRRKHSEVLREALPLEGARIADVGCGDGGLVRFMARQGARVTGIEPSAGQLGRARAAEPAADEDYRQGRAEALPFAEGELDAVVFFNSLHHVPVEVQGAALDEAARVLRPGGCVYVVEPLAEGRFFELMRPIEDETHVRAKALEALEAARARPDLSEEREDFYDAPYKYDSFEAFRDGIVAVDEGRRARVEAAEEALRAGFEAAAEARDGAFWFTQPCRLNLLRKTG